MIEVFTKALCPFCTKAKNRLKKLALDFTERDVTMDEAAREEMFQRSGRRTVPQIFIGAHHVGGWDDLSKLRAHEVHLLAEKNNDHHG